MPRAESATAPSKMVMVPQPLPTKQVIEGTIMDPGFFEDLEEVEDFINVVLYGREGSGKTTAAARLVNSTPIGNLLVINAEGGLKKIALRKRGVDTPRIKTWPKRGERITHKGLINLCNTLRADLTKDPNSWIGVVIDSATEVHTALLDTVQKKRVGVLKNKGQDVDEDHVDIADYGTMSKMFRDVLRMYRDLPCHVVITALERRDIDKDTGKPQYGPAVTPGIQNDLLGYVDFVLMMKAADEDGPFRALTRANSRYRAKDRFDVLPRVLAEPMLDRVLGYVTGDLTEDADPFQDDLPKKAKKAQDKADEPASTEDDVPDASADSDK